MDVSLCGRKHKDIMKSDIKVFWLQKVRQNYSSSYASVNSVIRICEYTSIERNTKDNVVYNKKFTMFNHALHISNESIIGTNVRMSNNEGSHKCSEQSIINNHGYNKLSHSATMTDDIHVTRLCNITLSNRAAKFAK